MARTWIAALSLVAALGAAWAAFWLQSRDGARAPATMPAAAPLAALLDKEIEGFAAAQAPWRFSYPDDHGAHSDHRTESWQITGTVSDAQGREFGFQLAFLRIGVVPPGRPVGPSRWAARDVYSGRFSLTEVRQSRFHAFERVARAAMGFAGADSRPVRVWLNGWEVHSAGQPMSFSVSAIEGDVAIALSLHAGKPAVQRTAETFHAYLLTRLRASGTIRTAGGSFDVKGDAWLDHAWGAIPLPLGPVVWDRFLLQLNDGRELMVVRLRRRDGTGQPRLTGLLVQRDGSSHELAGDALSLEPLDHWTSGDGRVRYPVRWRMRLPAEKLALEIAPYLPDQELKLSLRYWGGAVSVGGTVRGKAVQGTGHVELLGYGETPHRD